MVSSKWVCVNMFSYSQESLHNPCAVPSFCLLFEVKPIPPLMRNDKIYKTRFSPLCHTCHTCEIHLLSVWVFASISLFTPQSLSSVPTVDQLWIIPPHDIRTHFSMLIWPLVCARMCVCVVWIANCSLTIQHWWWWFMASRCLSFNL